MAGIGFKLQKLLSGDDYTSTVKAFAFSTLITAGPFLITIALIVFIQFIAKDSLTDRGLSYLQSLVTYCYAFSLVTVGPSYLVLTRYVADEYYRGHVTSFTASFFSAVTINLLVWGPLVFWYFSGLGVGWNIKLCAVLLYMLAVAIWLAMIFLSAAQDYWQVSRAFILGLLCSLAAAWFLGRQHGLPGYFAGFVLGQFVVLLGLLDAIFKEFGYWEATDHQWLSYFRIHPRLAAIGFFYNLGIWIDKFAFWISPEGEWLDPRLRYAPIYDTPMFVAYLTIMPAMVYFFLLIETDFFGKYHNYYNAVQNQEGLPVLERRREGIVRSLNFNLGKALTVQTICSGFALMLAPWIIWVLQMDPVQLSVLRMGTYSAYLQACSLILMNIILYFDQTEDAFKVSALFCIGNAVFTEITLHLGLLSYGYGYGLACLLSSALAVYYLIDRVKDLHYWTFSRQPFPEPVVVADGKDTEL